MKHSDRLARAGAVLAMVLVALVALELTAYALFVPLAGRQFDYAALQERRLARLTHITGRLGGGPDSAGVFRLHPYLGFTGRPGAHPWSQEPTPYNDFGFLSLAGYPYPYHRQADEFIIGLFGGSVAEGFANTAAADLQADLAALAPAFRNRRVVVLPMATGGYKQPQQLFLLEYALLAGFDFDAVVNLDGFNELVFTAENLERGTDPLFPSGGHYELMAKAAASGLSRAEVDRLAAIFSQYERERAVLTLVGMPVLRRSVFLNLLAVRWSDASESRIQTLNRELLSAPENGASAPERPAPPPDDELAATATRIWHQSSELMYATCRAQGIVYVHALQPNQYVAGSKPLTANERRVAYKPDAPWPTRARKGYPALIAAGRLMQADGLPFYDLTMIFRDVTADLYTDDCCHFGPLGQEILAHEIARALVAERGRQQVR